MTSTQELNSLASTMRHDHGLQLSELACMAYLSRRLLTQFSEQHRVDLSRLLDWQQQVLFGYTAGRGIPETDMRGAIEALERAGATVAYLSSLPS